MKRIPLTQGQFAIVDDDDFERLNQYRWHARHDEKRYCYSAVRNFKDRTGRIRIIYMHRFIMNYPEGLDVDHINHNTIDNRKTNLRICTRSQNLMNSKKRKNTSSKYKGVCWNKRQNKWIGYIKTSNQKIQYLGYFKNEKQAAIAYNEKAIKLHGEFAHINCIEVKT